MQDGDSKGSAYAAAGSGRSGICRHLPAQIAARFDIEIAVSQDSAVSFTETRLRFCTGNHQRQDRCDGNAARGTCGRADCLIFIQICRYIHAAKLRLFFVFRLICRSLLQRDLCIVFDHSLDFRTGDRHCNACTDAHILSFFIALGVACCCELVLSVGRNLKIAAGQCDVCRFIDLRIRSDGRYVHSDCTADTDISVTVSGFGFDFVFGFFVRIDYKSIGLDLCVFHICIIFINQNTDCHRCPDRHRIAAVLAGTVSGLHARCESRTDLEACIFADLIRENHGIFRSSSGCLQINGLAACRKCHGDTAFFDLVTVVRCQDECILLSCIRQFSRKVDLTVCHIRCADLDGFLFDDRNKFEIDPAICSISQADFRAAHVNRIRNRIIPDILFIFNQPFRRLFRSQIAADVKGQRFDLLSGLDRFFFQINFESFTCADLFGTCLNQILIPFIKILFFKDDRMDLVVKISGDRHSSIRHNKGILAVFDLQLFLCFLTIQCVGHIHFSQCACMSCAGID